MLTPRVFEQNNLSSDQRNYTTIDCGLSQHSMKRSALLRRPLVLALFLRSSRAPFLQTKAQPRSRFSGSTPRCTSRRRPAQTLTRNTIIIALARWTSEVCRQSVETSDMTLEQSPSSRPGRRRRIRPNQAKPTQPRRPQEQCLSSASSCASSKCQTHSSNSFATASAGTLAHNCMAFFNFLTSCGNLAVAPAFVGSRPAPSRCLPLGLPNDLGPLGTFRAAFGMSPFHSPLAHICSLRQCRLSYVTCHPRCAHRRSP